MSSWRIEFNTRARSILKVFGIAMVAVGLVAASPQPSEANSKYAAIVVDTASGKVLYQANADDRRYPASLTKMMTLYVLFEDLERGRFKLSSQFSVSANAAAQPPSKLGLRAGQTIAVEDAIKALVTKSANDVAAVVGENVSGSVPAFADRMTKTARALDMNSTAFKNPHGLPNKAQYTTARDMMKLGVALQVRFPTYYKYFQTRAFTYRGTKMGNHNRLLGAVEGVDGIKTGFINASGFNLVTSVKRDGRKVVAVVMGGVSARSRDDHMKKLIATHLPKASRADGYAPQLVAAVRNAPKVAAGGAVAAAAAPAIPASLAKHPRPVPRPFIEVAETAVGEDPAVQATAFAALPPARVQREGEHLDELAALLPADESEGASQGDAELTTADAPRPGQAPVVIHPTADGERRVRTVALPVPKEYVPDDVAGLPSSAAEAFADIAPSPGHYAEHSAALAAIIEARISAAAFDAADQPVAERTTEPERTAAAQPPQPVSKSAVPPEAISGWLIQIGAVGSEAAANALLDKAKTKAGKALAGAAPLTETFAKGNQTFVRARFAGFDSQKKAQNACAALKKNEFACFALRL